MDGEFMVAQPSILSQLKSLLLRYRFIIMALVMTMFGFLLIVFGKNFSHGEIWRDFGIAILTAGTLGLGIEFYTRRQFETLIADRMLDAIEISSLPTRLDNVHRLLSLGDEMTSLGLRKIHTINSPAIDFFGLLEAAEPGSEIRLLGVCMMSFTNGPMQMLLQRKLEQGCTIKLLTMDSESEFVKLRAQEEVRMLEDIRVEIEATNNLHRGFINFRIPANLRENLELRHYDLPATYLIVSTNKTMIVGFYLRRGRGELFPHLELEAKGGGIYASFLQHFDSMWNEPKQARIEQSGEAASAAEVLSQRRD
ncbi:MAG: hypothetical protein AABN95_03200 [Acidobacteriota bacterium]